MLDRHRHHYLKSIIGINNKLGILAHHDKVQLQHKGHNSESYIFGVMPLLTKILSRMMAPDRRTLVPHAVLLFLFCRRCVTAQRSLLESGTMGTKGHTQVIVAHLTESYGSQVLVLDSHTYSQFLILYDENVLKDNVVSKFCLIW